MTAETIVLKFGGTSVGSPERLRAVAAIIAEYRKRVPRVVVVVSAMGQSTDELIDLALRVSPKAMGAENRREMDMLLSTGERVSMSLLSLALADLGIKAVSFTGSQSGIITDTIHGEARIADIRPIRLVPALNEGRVVIVAGFQGVSFDKEITTLGRGGSDTTAVALASALGAGRVVIFTDVDGFYSADPRKVPAAVKHARLGWDTALLSAHFGAQVLHPRCVEAAWKHNLPIELRSSFTDAAGTLIEGVEDMSLEGSKVFTVSSQRKIHRFVIDDISEANAQKLFLAIREKGLKVFNWKKTGGELSLTTDDGTFVTWALGTKGKARSSVVSQVTIVGTGLLNSPEIFSRFSEIAAASGFEPIDTEVHPTYITVLLPEGADVDAIVRNAHSLLGNG